MFHFLEPLMSELDQKIHQEAIKQFETLNGTKNKELSLMAREHMVG